MAKAKTAGRVKSENKPAKAKSPAKKASGAKAAPAKKDNSIAKENYGPRIKDLRIACKLTQGEVAQALGVTPGYISNVENNRTAMSLRILIYFAKLTGQTLDSLVGVVEPDYTESALDNKLKAQLAQLSDADKEKMFKTLKIWF